MVYPSDKQHYFDFEIKIDKKTAIKRRFDGNIYSPNVRYQVDIKEHIGTIINEIRNVLSQKKFTENYGEVKI